MKVELHLHTRRYSGCATATPAEMMRTLIAAGYEAVYITEHDAVWSAAEIAELQEAFPPIRIFPGVELSVGTGVMPLQHLLVLGTTDPDLLAVRDAGRVLAIRQVDRRYERHLRRSVHFGPPFQRFRRNAP